MYNAIKIDYEILEIRIVIVLKNSKKKNLIFNIKNKKLKSQFRVANVINFNNSNLNLDFNNLDCENFVRYLIFSNRYIIVFVFSENRYNRFNILIIIKKFIVQKFNNKYSNVENFYKIDKNKYI